MNLSRRGLLGGAGLVAMAAPSLVRSLLLPSITVATQSAMTEAEIEAVVNGLLTPSIIGGDIAKIFTRCLVDGGGARVYLNDDDVAVGYVRPQELYIDA